MCDTAALECRFATEGEDSRIFVSNFIVAVGTRAGSKRGDADEG